MDSTSLRLTLLLIGLVILGLIWFLHKPEGRGRSPGATRRDGPKRQEPAVPHTGGRAGAGDDDSEHDPDHNRNDDRDRRGAASEPRQTQLPDLGSEAPDWSADSPRPSEAERLRSAAEAAPARNERKAKADGDSRRPAGKRVEPRIESPRSATPDPRLEPTWPGDEAVADERDAGGASAGRSGSPGEAPKVVTLYLRARGDRLISGLTLLDSAIKAGLRFGEMKIFHRRHQGAGKPVFSMANITRPGTFDPSGWNLFETPGVTLFLTLPGPVSALDAWDAMLATSQRLSELLEADLMDDAQCLLTRQRISQIREEMREFDRKAGIGP
jgi:cell division protein ZipA